MTELRPIDAALRTLSALAEPVLSPESRTWWPFLLVAAALSLVIAVARGDRGPGLLCRALGLELWRSPSALVDLQLVAVRQLIGLLGLLPRVGSALVLATGLVRLLDRLFGRPELAVPAPVALAIAYSIVLFVVWDLSRYLLHRLLHAIPLLWQFHQVHHSAEVLTPMTFHRVHPVEVVLYELRGVLVTGLLAGIAFWLWRGQAVALTVLGVDAVGFVLNGLLGNLRHSHVWLGFGPRLERWFLSPAQHQIHHGADSSDRNLGVWLACWDRLGGTLELAAEAPRVLGLREANHNQDLSSALLGPFVAVFRHIRGTFAVAAALILLPRVAAAEDEAPSGEIIVSDDTGVPAVGGAAHEVDEETLERYEHDDIQRVLARVPGVYVRGEDGFGLRPNIGMRGAASDRSAKITLLEDGVPLAPAPYAAPAAYYFPITTRLVGVEVFKGPAAIAFGPQTIGGTVNVLTRRIPDEKDGAVDAAFGAWSTVKLHAWGGASGARAGVMVEGAHLSSGGFKELDGGGPTGFQRQDALLKARLALPGGDRNTLELKLGYGRESSNETYLGITSADFAESPYRRYAASQLDHMSWQHTQASLSWDLLLSERLALRAVAYHSYLDRSWTKLNRFNGGPDLHELLLKPDAGQAATYVAILRGEEDSASADQELLIGTNARTFHNYGVQSVARLWSGSGRVSNLAELGIRVHGDHGVRVHTEDPFRMVSGSLLPTGGETELTLDSVSEALAFAAHASDTLELGGFTVAPGARVERIRTAAGDRDSGVMDPQVRTIGLAGLSLSAEAALPVVGFAGVHRGFSPVSPGEDAEVLPETAWNAEAGLRLFPGSTYAEVVGFGSRYDNLHGQCTLSAGCIDEVDRQFNGGQALVAGLESVASHHFALPIDATLLANASYTFTWSSFQSDFVSGFPLWGTVSVGDRLPYVPMHQGAVELALQSPRGSLGATGTLRGEMRDVAGQGEIPAEERIPPAALFDLAGELRLSPQVRAYALVRNVANTATIESQRPFGARPGAPRTVMVGVKVAPVE